MALDLTDVIAVQKTAGGPGSVRKSTVQALINLASSAAGFWQRSDDTLRPANPGDDLESIGEISAQHIALTGDIQAANATFSGTLEADSIDGGEYAT